MAYFVFVYVLMPGYEHKQTQRTDINIIDSRMYVNFLGEDMYSE